MDVKPDGKFVNVCRYTWALIACKLMPVHLGVEYQQVGLCTAPRGPLPGECWYTCTLISEVSVCTLGIKNLQVSLYTGY